MAIFAQLLLALAVMPVHAGTSAEESLVREKWAKIKANPKVQEVTKNLEDNLKVLHQKADGLAEGTISATERAWKRQVDTLWSDWNATDGPRKLREGDWNVWHETEWLMDNMPDQLKKPDDGASQ